MTEAAAQLGASAALVPARLLSDQRLARRVAAGDERAFAALYGRYHQRLYRYCLGVVGNAEDAEDALQSTMLKAMRALGAERREIELKPWLYRIAHNESIDLIRRRRGAERLDPERPAAGAEPAEEVERRQRLRALLADIGELPERQRGALVMRELSGLGAEEIAAALGTSPAVARQTLYEARLGLREMQAGRELSCGAVTRALSDGDGRVARRRDIRAHLRDCEGCRAFGEAMRARRADFAALAPLPGVAAAAILQGLLGGHGPGGGGLAGALGASGGAAKAVGTATAMKAVATVAVVAAVGVAAADRSGLVSLGLPGEGHGSQSASGSPSPAGSPPRSAVAAAAGAGHRAAAGARPARLGVARANATARARRAATGRGATRATARPAEAASGPAPTRPPPHPVAASPPGRALGHENGAGAHAHGAGNGRASSAPGHAGAQGNGSSHGHPATPAAPAHPSKPPPPAHPAHPAPPTQPAEGRPAETEQGQGGHEPAAPPRQPPQAGGPSAE